MKKSDLLFAGIVCLMLNINLSLSAQEVKVANKFFYTEYGGPGVIMSANFDSRFNSNSRLGFGFRAGAGFGVRQESYNTNGWIDYRTKTYYSIPLGLNYVFGKPNSVHTFEAGAGFTILTRKVNLYYYNNDNEKPGNVIGFFTFMYRKMPEDGGFSWRIGLTPIIGTSGDMVPSIAVGFGYVF